MTIHKSGLALDIDDTLSQTLLYWIQGLQEKLGGLEDMSPAEIVKKYKHTRNVPEWNTPEAMEYISGLCNSNSLQEVIPVVEGAIDSVERINNIVPIVAYITARPQTVENGTMKWLKKHGFPEAPLITRPPSVSIPDGMKWKAKELVTRFPQIQGIIDNDAILAEYLSDTYQGHIFIFSHSSVPKNASTKIHACPDWESVVQQVKKVF
jgi:hypothetical protein